MNRVLEDLAVRRPHWKFLRMHVSDIVLITRLSFRSSRFRQASEHGVSVDRITLPVLSVYRANCVVEVAAGLAMQLGDFFTASDVESLLDGIVATVR